LKKPYKEYMLKLVKNLETVAKIAELNCQFTQKKYQDQRNEGTKPKSFEVGSRVVVLIPDSSHKIRSQWGLGTVISKVSRNSFRIQMDETGQIKILHSDKLRHFHTRVQHLGVIVDGVSDFVNVPSDVKCNSNTCVDMNDSILCEFDECIKQIDLSHLSESNRDKLLEVLCKHKALFTNKTGACNIAEHSIDVTPDFVLKQFSAYRFPQKLIPEIESKIPEMEKDGFIVKSKSKMVNLRC